MKGWLTNFLGLKDSGPYLAGGVIAGGSWTARVQWVGGQLHHADVCAGGIWLLQVHPGQNSTRALDLRFWIEPNLQDSIASLVALDTKHHLPMLERYRLTAAWLEDVIELEATSQPYTPSRAVIRAWKAEINGRNQAD